MSICFLLSACFFSMKDLPRPQCQPNQTYCTAGEALLAMSAGLWAMARACHQNRKKNPEITWRYVSEEKAKSSNVNKACQTVMCSCHDLSIFYHSPNLLNSALNCTALVVAVLYKNL